MYEQDEKLSEEMDRNLCEDEWLSSVNVMSQSLDDLFPEINEFLRNESLDCNDVKLEAKLYQGASHRKTLVTDTNGKFLYMKASCSNTTSNSLTFKRQFIVFI